MESLTDQTLIQAATKAREAAYVPYSHFAVGAAVQVGDQIFTGANIENASYGLSLCAERNAIFQAVLAGHTHLDKIAVIADTKGPVSPCGACRQVMTEFMDPTATVLLTNLDGDLSQNQLQALIPGAFTKEDLHD